MSDWEQFLQEVSWFVRPGDSVTVGEAQPWTRGSAKDLPELSALLDSTTLTPISVGDDVYPDLGQVLALAGGASR